MFICFEWIWKTCRLANNFGETQYNLSTDKLRILFSKRGIHFYEYHQRTEGDCDFSTLWEMTLVFLQSLSINSSFVFVSFSNVLPRFINEALLTTCCNQGIMFLAQCSISITPENVRKPLVF